MKKNWYILFNANGRFLNVKDKSHIFDVEKFSLWTKVSSNDNDDNKDDDLVGSGSHATDETDGLVTEIGDEAWTLRFGTHHFHRYSQLIEQLPTYTPQLDSCSRAQIIS